MIYLGKCFLDSSLEKCPTEYMFVSICIVSFVAAVSNQSIEPQYRAAEEAAGVSAVYQHTYPVVGSWCRKWFWDGKPFFFQEPCFRRLFNTLHGMYR